MSQKASNPRSNAIDPLDQGAARLLEQVAVLVIERADRGIIVRHVFHRRGRSPITEFPYGVFHGACERAEIGGRRKIHDFRRSAARNYVKAGVHSHTVMRAIGWKQDSMLRRYNIQTESDLRDAAAQVGAARVSGTEPRDKGTVTPISKN